MGFHVRFHCNFVFNFLFTNFSANEDLTNAFAREIESLKADIGVLNCEIETLKSRTLLIESTDSKINMIEEELNALRAVLNSDKTRQKQYSCDMCEFKSENETDVKQHRSSHHEIKKTTSEQILMFKCEYCDYESSSRKGVNIHKGSKHKQEKVPSSNHLLISASTSRSLKPSIPCYRQDEGCTNILVDYYDHHSAICESCTEILERKLKESPFPCPCCHDQVGGEQFSLCSECLASLSEDGFSESEWGSWVLDRDNGKIICQQLDF